MSTWPTGLDVGQPPITLVLPEHPPVELTVQGEAEPLGRWVVFKSCDYFTEEEARLAGSKFGDALLTAGAIYKLGIDIGFSKSSLSFSKMVDDTVRKVSGKDLRPEVHGLMVFERDAVAIVNLNATATITIDKAKLQEHLGACMRSIGPMTERQRVCAALINDGFFSANIEGQFILRVSAVEAMCDQHVVGSEYIEIIDALSDYLDEIAADEEAKETAHNLLNSARRQSLRQAYMKKITALLGKENAKKFDHLYGLRSKLVHDGIGRGQLSQASTDALDIATRLLQADLVSA